MAIEDRLERVVRDIYRIRSSGGNWQGTTKIRIEMQALWKETDILAAEFCDVLQISMEELDRLLDESRNRIKQEKGKAWWEENFEVGLPLFIPIKIRGI
jgi:RNA polymerase-interacting CarD/CdnL/TRCF family regulator